VLAEVPPSECEEAARRVAQCILARRDSPAAARDQTSVAG
jgi:hypothetical protein